MPAGTEQLRPSIQTCPIRLKNDMELFFNAQIAPFSHWVEWLTPIYDTPRNVVIQVQVLEVPDIAGQGG